PLGAQARELGGQRRDGGGELGARRRDGGDGGQAAVDLVGLVAAGALVGEAAAGHVQRRQRRARRARVRGDDIGARKGAAGPPREQRRQLPVPARERAAAAVDRDGRGRRRHA